VKPVFTKWTFDTDLIDLERKIFLKEIKRFEEFADVADNSLECFNKIYEIQRKLY